MTTAKAELVGHAASGIDNVLISQLRLLIVGNGSLCLTRAQIHQSDMIRQSSTGSLKQCLLYYQVVFEIVRGSCDSNVSERPCRIEPSNVANHRLPLLLGSGTRAEGLPSSRVMKQEGGHSRKCCGSKGNVTMRTCRQLERH